MDRVLGVWCTQSEILLAVAVDGKLIDGFTEKLDAPELLEASERLMGLLDRTNRMLEEVGPGNVRVLMPEQTYKATYIRMAPRAALDTLVRLAAVTQGIPVEMLARTTVRSRLKLPKKGPFEAHIASVVAAPVGRYWGAGRNLAAVAALADD
jgi:hypothetical protein